MGFRPVSSVEFGRKMGLAEGRTDTVYMPLVEVRWDLGRGPVGI